ncbi:MAG TPA: helix-hairpin-helix domain-containing protein [Bacillota bacterium]|nr:helix-hairpin-helix domain-containing protein [Bacillota bacterium]
MFGTLTLREKIILGLLAALLLTGAAWRIWRSPRPAVEPVALEPETRFAAEEPELITVHAVGAVKQPGVYRLPAGSRVHDLLDLAGGPAEEADLEAINLARPLIDGEQVQFYRFGEHGAPLPGSAPGKININRATAAELEALPGIGPAKARSIVEHREKNGYFKDITEIMDVSGIGEATFHAIEDLITVY